MATKRTLFDKMKSNPKGDWTINNVKTLCKQNGLTIVPPASGSHYVIHSPYIDGILSVPARRPIKPIYIRQLVGLCEAHNNHRNEKEGK